MENFNAILAISAPLDCFQFDCDSSGLKICGKTRKNPLKPKFQRVLVEISGIEPLTS